MRLMLVAFSLILVLPLQAAPIFIAQGEAASLEATIQISGHVVDKETGLSLKSVTIHVSNGTQNYDFDHQTDQPVDSNENGHFNAVVKKAGRKQVFIRHPNYLNFVYYLQIPEDARIVQAGRLELERGIMVKGRVRREDDRQAPRLKLWFKDKARQMQDVETNGQSEFSIGPLHKGPWQVSVEGSAGWKIVPDETILLEGRADVPQLVITVRQGENESLKGRVVTAEGKPIPYARVVANIYDAFQGGMREDDTDREGFYVLPNVTGARNVKITQVIAGGYALLQIGEAKRKNGEWLATDSVMARRDAQVSGRVVDANGVPQAGVLVVSSEQIQFRPITTNEDGAFQIEDLLGGDITVLAARGREFGEVVIKAGQHKPVEVRLQLPGSFIAPMQQQLLERVAKDGFGYSWPTSWNELGTERVFHLCLQKDGVLPPSVPPAEFEADDVNWALAGDGMRRFWWWAAKQDPSWTVQYAPRYLSLTPEKVKSQDTWISAIARVASAVATNGNEQQRAWSAEWLNAALKIPPSHSQKSSDAARYWFQVVRMPLSKITFSKPL